MIYTEVFKLIQVEGQDREIPQLEFVLESVIIEKGD